MNKKVVLITDATEEIGNEVALLFASKGYNVVICYNENRKKAYELRKCIKNNYNVETQVIKSSIASTQNAKKTITSVIKKFNRIDTVINNSGIIYDKDFNKITIEEFEKTFKLNIGGSFIISKEASKYMKKGSTIVNISLTTITDDNNYNISKLGLQSLTRDLAFELRPNIRVNAVAVKLDKSLKSKKKTIKKQEKLNTISKTIYYLSSKESISINGEIATIN